MTYSPKPVDTSGIALPREMEELLETLAENTHTIWAAQRRAEGWRHGPRRDDGKKEHPDLVPYAELPETEKEYDRQATKETLKLILKLGFRIETPSR